MTQKTTRNMATEATGERETTPAARAQPAGWSARTIECAGFAMQAHESGAGDDALCLGFADPPACRMLEDLAARLRLSALAPACAPLEGPPDLHSTALAACALACAHDLGLKEFAVLARGDADHAALRLALRAPERVRALCLLSPDLHSGDGAAGDAELLESLAQVRAPTLAAFGALDRAAPRNARLMRERLPDCRVALLHDAAEEPEAVRPHALARMICAFLGAPHSFSATQDPAWTHGPHT